MGRTKKSKPGHAQREREKNDLLSQKGLSSSSNNQDKKGVSTQKPAKGKKRARSPSSVDTGRNVSTSIASSKNQEKTDFIVEEGSRKPTPDDAHGSDSHSRGKKRRGAGDPRRLGLMDEEGNGGEEVDEPEGLASLPNVLAHSQDEQLSLRTGIPSSTFQALKKTATVGASHIITSSKMQQRIGSVLKFLNHSDPPPKANGMERPLEKKARIMLLTCHEKAISKLVSIVELIKNNRGEASEEGKGSGKGNGKGYWQYNKIVPKTIELTEPNHHQNGKQSMMDTALTTSTATVAQGTTSAIQHQSQTHCLTTKPETIPNNNADEDDDNEDPAFENMTLPAIATTTTASQLPGTQQVNDKRKPKIRVVPTLAICLATAPVPALEAHGFRLQRGMGEGKRDG